MAPDLLTICVSAFVSVFVLLTVLALALRLGDHLGLPPRLHKNISYGYYPAGHMMYVHEPSLKQLKADLTAFYKSAAGTK